MWCLVLNYDVLLLLDIFTFLNYYRVCVSVCIALGLLSYFSLF